MSKTYRINNTILSFDEIYYVDPVNGLDTNNGQTQSTSFKTITPYLAKTQDYTACILSAGTHIVNSLNTIFTSGLNLERTIIGQGFSTILSLTTANVVYTINRTKSNSFIRMQILPASGNAAVSHDGVSGGSQRMVKYFNVAFNPNASQTYGIMHIATGGDNAETTSSYTNCTTKLFSFNYKSTQNLIMTGLGITNCVQTSLNVGLAPTTSVIAAAADISAEYKIINSNIAWQNTGTGQNPDGTTANIGVYGGLYAWGSWESIPNPLTISGEDTTLSPNKNKPIISYWVNDMFLNTNLKITEKIDGTMIRQIFNANRQPYEYTFEITDKNWWRQPAKPIDYTITVDNEFFYYIRTYTVWRLVDNIDVYTTTPEETPNYAKILHNIVIQGQFTPGNTSVEVCNNGFDDVPSWEQIPDLSQPYNFINRSKTASKWGVLMRIKILRGTDEMVSWAGTSCEILVGA